jgi:hypothetical protein
MARECCTVLIDPWTIRRRSFSLMYCIRQMFSRRFSESVKANVELES